MILGLPNLLGLVAAAALGTLVLFIRPGVNRAFLLLVAEALSGFVAVFAGVAIARVLNLTPTAWLPMLAGVWFGIHFLRGEKTAEFSRAAVGLLAGWWAYTAIAI